MSSYEEFEGMWERFVNLCRGKIIEKSGHAPLTAVAARSAVAAASSVWTDKYDPCGKWLSGLRESDADKAERITELMQSIEFVDVPEEKQISDFLVAGTAAGGAVVGAGVSRLLGAALPIGVASAVVPALVLFPLMKGMQKQKKETAEKRLVDEYVGQLENVRRVAVEVLSGGALK